MSSRDIAELPREHIFTLVLFFRDQTGGEYRAAVQFHPQTAAASQSIPLHGMELSNLLSSPLLSFCKGGMAT